jgi:hypothetical protein
MIFLKIFFSFYELEVTSTRYGAGPVERGLGFGQNASNKIQKNETVVCSSVRKRVTILFKKKLI